MKNANTAVKNNFRIIEGDHNKQSADNMELQRLPVMKSIKEMVELTGLSKVQHGKGTEICSYKMMAS